MLGLDLVFVGIAKSKRFAGVVIFSKEIESLVDVATTGSFEGEAVLPCEFASLSGLTAFSGSGVDVQITSRLASHCCAC